MHIFYIWSKTFAYTFFHPLLIKIIIYIAIFWELLCFWVHYISLLMESIFGDWPSYDPHNFSQLRPSDPSNPSVRSQFSFKGWIFLCFWDESLNLWCFVNCSYLIIIWFWFAVLIMGYCDFFLIFILVAEIMEFYLAHIICNMS